MKNLEDWKVGDLLCELTTNGFEPIYVIKAIKKEKRTKCISFVLIKKDTNFERTITIDNCNYQLDAKCIITDWLGCPRCVMESTQEADNYNKLFKYFEKIKREEFGNELRQKLLEVKKFIGF